jgi:hypothetical protein
MGGALDHLGASPRHEELDPFRGGGGHQHIMGSEQPECLAPDVWESSTQVLFPQQIQAQG